MEKCTNATKDMLSIKRIKDGKILTDQIDILNEAKNFYANLYTEKLEQDFRGRNSTIRAQKQYKQMLRKLSKTVSCKNRGNL